MSFGGSGSGAFTVKKFESQQEVEEKKKKRQENWEKVRKPDDPEECPEEETRSLFQQLEDNKASQDKEFEDQNRIRNSVQGLEEEEAKFLNFVSNRQMQLEREREKEENVVLEQMKEAAVKRVMEKSQPTPDAKKTSPQASSSSSSSTSAKKSQQSLLMGAIKRKSTETSSDEASKRPRSESDTSPTGSPTAADDKLLKLIDRTKPVAQVAGILPGIGCYTDDTSDSDSFSAESDVEDYMPVKKVVRVHIQQN